MELSRALVTAPIDAIAQHCRDARQRALVELVHRVTTAPWTITSADRERWNLDDDELLHAIALSAYFGHLNRIADAVGVPLDYPVALVAPPADPTTAPMLAAPAALTGPRAIELERRPATAAAIAAWRAYLAAKSGPLAPRDRADIERWVAGWTGSGSNDDGVDDTPLRALARLITLAPWRLDDRAFAPLRADGWTDAALFDACVTASSANTFARIDVALRALAS